MPPRLARHPRLRCNRQRLLLLSSGRMATKVAWAGEQPIIFIAMALGNLLARTQPSESADTLQLTPFLVSYVEHYILLSAGIGRLMCLPSFSRCVVLHFRYSTINSWIWASCHSGTLAFFSLPFLVLITTSTTCAGRQFHAKLVIVHQSQPEPPTFSLPLFVRFERS